MEMFMGVFSAIWLGILTSISPCPLATNIVAISYIGKQMENPQKIFLSGLLYTLGRTLTYTVLGILLTAGILLVPELSSFLRQYMNKFLGPILILIGMILLELITIHFSISSGDNEKLQHRVNKMGIYGAGLLGIVFALSFCPVSAALFFGALLPLSEEFKSPVVLPSLYGIGTAVPVILFAFLIAFAAQYLSRAYNKLQQVEKWLRKITGLIFIIVGIYYSLTFIFEVL